MVLTRVHNFAKELIIESMLNEQSEAGTQHNRHARVSSFYRG